MKSIPIRQRKMMTTRQKIALLEEDIDNLISANESWTDEILNNEKKIKKKTEKIIELSRTAI